jgi:hypothetical protein
MLVTKTKGELASESFKLAQGHRLVRYGNVTYIPADYETLDTSITPDVDRTIWLPMSTEQIARLAAEQFDTLFANTTERSNFEYMVAQNADLVEDKVTALLVRTPEGLRELTRQGLLVEATGVFRPNTMSPMLNTDEAAKAEVFGVIEGWLNSEEEAESLLNHLASSLAPHWSAVKYVLLIGEGRNGKSVLLRMLQALFGLENCSSVTRQQISEASPSVLDLNGKLLNIVFDGMATYLKDSGMEKSLIAGEPVGIRRLYDSMNTTVQTNALFLEGLNREPKTGDKSTALQKRLVRYQFPNVYPLNKGFEKHMLSEQMLGAFLSLLIDRYVVEEEVAEALALTSKGEALQLEQMYINSIGLQFLKYVHDHDPLGIDGVLGKSTTDLVAEFKSWRVRDNSDIGSWPEPDVLAQLNPCLNTERRSVREGTKVVKVRFVTSLKYEAKMFIDSLQGEEVPDDSPAVVED